MPKRVLYALDALWGHRLVAFMVILTSIGVIFLGVKDSRQTQCNARYNEAQAKSQQARAVAADRDRAALRAMLQSLVDETPSDARIEIERYLDTLDETDRERRENPVPPPPPDLCK